MILAHQFNRKACLRKSEMGYCFFAIARVRLVGRERFFVNLFNASFFYESNPVEFGVVLGKRADKG